MTRPMTCNMAQGTKEYEQVIVTWSTSFSDYENDVINPSKLLCDDREEGLPKLKKYRFKIASCLPDSREILTVESPNDT